MAKLHIEGQKKLDGSISVQGAKNSALPILAGTVLCKDVCVLHNCPNLSDVETCAKIIRYLGGKVKREGTTLTVDTTVINKFDIPDELMREMRSSIVFLGAIVARMGEAKLSMPGGCELGPRPIDMHLRAMQLLGVEVSDKCGSIECKTPNGITGTKINLLFPSVGATENIMLSAVLAKGYTEITNAAKEPEIFDLADFLNGCGAKINIIGDGTIYIEGVEKLNGYQHSIIPDRIVAATYLSAGAVTQSNLELTNVVPSHLNSIIPIIRGAGARIDVEGNTIRIKSNGKLKAIKETITTMPYPGFPTDAQAPILAMTTLAKGISVFKETIFESRYKHVGELMRLGANIKVSNEVAIVEGVESLYGGKVEAQDLRGGAALVVAGLAAYGQTQISNICYIERGYEDIELYLSSIGASIKKI